MRSYNSKYNQQVQLGENESFKGRSIDRAKRWLVGSILATTALNSLVADSAEMRQVSLTQETSVDDANQTERNLTEHQTVWQSESGPDLHVVFPDSPDFTAIAPDPSQINSFISEIAIITDEDPTAIVTISVHGSASDEDRSSSVNGDANLGSASVSNQKLAADYADITALQIESAIVQQSNPGSFDVGLIASSEALLTVDQISQLDAIADARDMTRFELVGANNDKTMQFDETESATLQSLIDQNRGAEITTIIERQVTVEEPLNQTLPPVAPIEYSATFDDAKDGSMPLLVPAAIPVRKKLSKDRQSIKSRLQPIVRRITRPVRRQYERTSNLHDINKANRQSRRKLRNSARASYK
ncbi:MAG: hypothetical protein EOP06_25745, partial [Proteobacteria bacterium]